MEIKMDKKEITHNGLFLKKEREKIPYNGDDLLFHRLFLPHINKIKIDSNIILSCPIEVFKRRLGITSNILDPMQELWDKETFFLSGGKLIDFFENKTLEESKSDYDLFFIDEPKKIKLLDAGYILTSQLGYLDEYVKDKIKVQCVNTIYASPEHIIQEFDIRACCICTDGKYIYWIKGSLKDIRKKKIVLTSPKVSHNVFLRIIKYIKKGYDIDIPDLTLASICLLDSLDEVLPKDILINRDYIQDSRTGYMAVEPERLQNIDIDF